jgi:hypothetical protein
MRGVQLVAGWVLMAGMVTGCAASGGVTAEEGTSSCASIESFAEQLVDVGFAYDYEPSSSPAELAQWVDVVIRGELTGEVEDLPASPDTGDLHVGYEIEVHEVLAGEVAEESGTVVVSMAYSPSHGEVSSYGDAAAPGVPVIVFASASTHAPGGLTPAVMEGFMTGCEGEAPIGWVGQLGEWSALTSLDDVAAAVRAGSE